MRLHYTLDVVLAIFLSATMWTSYHRIANDVAVGQEFVMVWLVDKEVVYPAIRWLESDSPPLKEITPDRVTKARSDSDGDSGEGQPGGES